MFDWVRKMFSNEVKITYVGTGVKQTVSGSNNIVSSGDLCIVNGAVMNRSGTPKTREELLTVQLDARRHINVIADNGDVTVLGEDRDDVAVTLTYFAYGKRQQEKLDNLYVEQPSPGKFVVRYHSDSQKLRNSAGVHFHMHVPIEVTTELQSSNGNLVVHDTKNSSQLKTSNGNVTLERIQSWCNVRTSNGDVTARVIGGDLTVESSMGDVSAEDVNGHLSIDGSNGDITAVRIHGDTWIKTSMGTVDLTTTHGTVYANTSTGDIDLVTSHSTQIELQSSLGEITCRAPHAFLGSVSMKTSLGDLECGFPVMGKIKSSKIEGTVGTGEGVITLKTSTGDITLKPI